MGAWMSGSNIGDWATLMFFGVLGYVMKQGGWPRPPIVLGFILGKIMENAMNLSVQVHGMGSFTRPIVLIITVLVVITVIFAVRGRLGRVKGAVGQTITGQEGGRQCPAVSLPIAAFMLILFVYAFVEATAWKFGPRVFPHSVIVVGVLLASMVVLRDIQALRQLRAGTAAPDVLRPDHTDLLLGVRFIAWLFGIVGATLILGQYVALLLFVALYLKVWGKFGWRLIAVYTGASATFLYVLFNMIVPVMWHESPFYSLFN
jgi:hypothetical protein